MIWICTLLYATAPTEGKRGHIWQESELGLWHLWSRLILHQQMRLHWSFNVISNDIGAIWLWMWVVDCFDEASLPILHLTVSHPSPDIVTSWEKKAGKAEKVVSWGTSKQASYHVVGKERVFCPAVSSKPCSSRFDLKSSLENWGYNSPFRS